MPEGERWKVNVRNEEEKNFIALSFNFLYLRQKSVRLCECACLLAEVQYQSDKSNWHRKSPQKIEEWANDEK